VRTLSLHDDEFADDETVSDEHDRERNEVGDERVDPEPPTAHEVREPATVAAVGDAAARSKQVDGEQELGVDREE